MTSSTQSQILDGKLVSKETLAKLARECSECSPKPKLVVIIVGEDPASQIYVQKKAKTAEEIGILSEIITYPSDISQDQLLEKIDHLNKDSSVHGILIQLPLPKHLDSNFVVSQVRFEKDVDGFHPTNLGNLLGGYCTGIVPCTPKGVIRLLHHYHIPLEGKQATVVGRSTIVGKPVAMLLLSENATVTLCHSRTQNLSDTLRKSDIIVAAIGQPRFITGDQIKEGAVVIDVGINRLDGKLFGDVDFDSVSQKASYITPVPGGVGPMTIAMLMENTVEQYKKQTA